MYVHPTISCGAVMVSSGRIAQLLSSVNSFKGFSIEEKNGSEWLQLDFSALCLESNEVFCDNFTKTLKVLSITISITLQKCIVFGLVSAWTPLQKCACTLPAHNLESPALCKAFYNTKDTRLSPHSKRTGCHIEYLHYLLECIQNFPEIWKTSVESDTKNIFKIYQCHCFILNLSGFSPSLWFLVQQFAIQTKAL